MGFAGLPLQRAFAVRRPAQLCSASHCSRERGNAAVTGFTT